MSIGRFYTLFWVVYYPLCIAYYDAIGLQYIDEFLTLGLIFFTFAFFNNRGNYHRLREVLSYVIVMAFYVLYSLVMAVNVSNAVWLDLQQQVRPYAVFYCTWLLAPTFSMRQKNIILGTMILTLVIYVLLIVLKPGTVANYGFVTPVTGQLSLMLAMAYYCFKPKILRTMLICILFLSVGLLSEKSKFYGEFVCFIGLMFFLHSKIKFNSPKTILQITALVVAVLFFSWEKFNTYYVKGFSEERIDEMARPATYATGVKILGDYFPFGSGLGTFSCNAAAVYYSPLYEKYGLDGYWGLTKDNPGFLADCFYPVLAQYGWVGILFFIIFWRRRIMETKYITDERYYKMALMCILALALESVADTSYLSGKGMGFFILLAICLNNKKIKDEKNIGNRKCELH